MFVFQIILKHIGEAGIKERMISADDKTGKSPLHLAAEGGFLKIAQVRYYIYNP